MGILLVIFSALVGFILGYFLQAVPLLWCTGIIAAVAIYLLWTTRNAGLVGLIGVAAVIYGFIGIATAWGTYFFSTEAHLSVFEFLRTNIFRAH